MRQAEVRFEPDGLLELGDRGVGLALGVKRGTQVVVRLGEVRFKPDGFLELGDGSVVLALGVKRGTQAVVRISIVRSAGSPEGGEREHQ